MSIYCIVIARSVSNVATDAAERVQRTSLLVLYRAARRKSHECGLIFLCCRIKKLKFLFTTFCQQKVVPKLRGDKFSGSQLAVGKMVAFALLRIKRSPFLNPPPALRPSSENSSAAFLLSPTEYFLSHVIPRHRRWRWGSSGRERVEDANRWTKVHRGMTC